MIRKENKSQNLYQRDYNLLTAQDLLQAHYQILLMILLKESTSLHVNTNTMTKDVELPELNTKAMIAFLNMIKDDLTECRCFLMEQEKRLMKIFRSYFLIYAHFLTVISVSSFCCCIKIFILMNAWMTGIN